MQTKTALYLQMSKVQLSTVFVCPQSTLPVLAAPYLRQVGKRTGGVFCYGKGSDMPPKGVKKTYESGRPRKTAEEYQRLAQSKHVSWIGEALPASINTLTLWRCENDHTWQSSYRMISKNQQSCPVCSRRVGASKLEAIHYEGLAIIKGLDWLGDLPKNSNSQTRWRCAHGHIFNSTYQQVIDRNVCPTCRKETGSRSVSSAYRKLQVPFKFINGRAVSKPQLYIQQMIGGDLNYSVDLFSVDIAIFQPDKRIAIEYDGQYWHSGNEIIDIQRDNYLLKKGWFILRIKANKLMPSIEALADALSRFSNENRYQEITLDWE
jgi:very-short-patch-repair endonuclease